jgi:hypothetical protein
MMFSLVNMEIGTEQHQRPEEDRKQGRPDSSNSARVSIVVVRGCDERANYHVDDRQNASSVHLECVRRAAR